MKIHMGAMILLGILSIGGQSLFGQSKDDQENENPFAGKVALVYVNSPHGISAESKANETMDDEEGRDRKGAGSMGFVLAKVRTISQGNREFLAGTGCDTGTKRGKMYKDLRIRVAWDSISVFYLVDLKTAKKRYPLGSFNNSSKEDEKSEEEFKGLVVIPSLSRNGNIFNCPLVDAKFVDHGGRKFLSGPGPRLEGTPYDELRRMSANVAWDSVMWYCLTTPQEYENKLKEAIAERSSRKESTSSDKDENEHLK
jgi:hypothetical protein